MRQSGRVRGGAEEGGEQSRRGSWSNLVSTSQYSLRTLGEASQILIKLNRQIPDLKALLSLRKQRTAECSNRQKTQFCSAQDSTRKLPTDSSNGHPPPGVSNRELLGIEILQLAENKRPRPVLIANFEPNDSPVIQAGHHQ
jgi:hypothetical protein